MFRVARNMLGKYHARWLEYREEGLEDRSSRPGPSPHRPPIAIEDLIELFRREHKIGPVKLAGTLRNVGHDVPVSTTHRVLVRRVIRAISPRTERIFASRSVAPSLRVDHTGR